MITIPMLNEFALMKQKEHMKEMKMIYELMKRTNPFEKWYEEIALMSWKKIKEESK